MEVLQRTANRGSISTGYDIAYSNKFESDNSESIIRNYAADIGANCIANNSTTNAKKFTVSYWVKKTELLASGQNIPWVAIAGGNATVVKFQDEKFAAYDDSAGWSLATNAVFRDTSAWYHLVCAVDTTQSTAANRVNLYVNGVLQTSFATESYGTQNADNQLWKLNTEHQIGGSSYFKGGYITEVHCIDGTQYAASDFGEFDEDSGIWKPKEADVTYGSQGYYLNWSDFGSANSNVNNTGVGKDHSGNTNPFANLNNWSSADIATDTPTNNFCTWNPLQTGWNTSYGTGQVIVEGATEAYASTNFAAIEGSMAVQSGKWYWESKPNRTGGIMVGVAALNGVRWAGDTAYWYLGMNAQGIGTILGNFYYNGTSTSTDATDWTNGDIVSIALDMDNYKIYMAVNGSWGGTSNPSTGSGGYDFSSASNFTNNFVIPAGRIETANSSYVIETAFGGYTTMSISSAASDANGYGTFEYAPPTGYYALCTKNLAEFG